VEVDGSGHDHAEIWMQDQKRQAELERLGVRFLRFQEVEVRSTLEGVVETLRDWIEQEKCGEGHPP
jgi:very-short-patch-repair endonuclease